jgi:carbonic anhydrase
MISILLLGGRGLSQTTEHNGHVLLSKTVSHDHNHTHHPVYTQTADDWSYKGKTGPTHWGDLSESYMKCKTGLQQSPIDITALTSSSIVTLYDRAPFSVSYAPIHNAIFEKVQYETARVLVPSHSRQTLIYKNTLFKMVNLHFHKRSEHYREGSDTAMELHVIHIARDNRTRLVMGIAIEEGKYTSPFLQQFLPLQTKNSIQIEYLDFSHLIKDIDNFNPVYNYIGSSTVPPCTEGVIWMLPKRSLQITEEDRKVFDLFLPNNAARPIQIPNVRPMDNVNTVGSTNSLPGTAINGNLILLVMILFI